MVVNVIVKHKLLEYLSYVVNTYSYLKDVKQVGVLHAYSCCYVLVFINICIYVMYVYVTRQYKTIIYVIAIFYVLRILT